MAACDTYLKKLTRAIDDSKVIEFGLGMGAPTFDYNSENTSPMDSGRNNVMSGMASGNDIYSSILPRQPGRLPAETLFIPVDSQQPTPRDLEFEKLAYRSLSQIKNQYRPDVDDLLTHKNYAEVLREKHLLANTYSQSNSNQNPKPSGLKKEKEIPHTTTLISIRETQEESLDQKFKEDEIVAEVGRIVDFYQKINKPLPTA